MATTRTFSSVHRPRPPSAPPPPASAPAPAACRRPGRGGRRRGPPAAGCHLAARSPAHPARRCRAGRRWSATWCSYRPTSSRPSCRSRSRTSRTGARGGPVARRRWPPLVRDRPRAAHRRGRRAAAGSDVPGVRAARPSRRATRTGCTPATSWSPRSGATGTWATAVPSTSTSPGCAASWARSTGSAIQTVRRVGYKYTPPTAR